LYPDGAPGLGRPAIGGPLDELLVLTTSNTPNPATVDQNILYSGDSGHAAVVVRFEDIAETVVGYSNVTAVAHPISFMVPGARSDERWVADDVSLISPDGCDASGYEIAVYGGGGPDFDAHVELFDFYETLFDFPGDWTCREILPVQIEGTGIPGTGREFTGLPGSAVSYLNVPLDTTLPERFWIYVSFSTDEAGWIIAGFPEIGDEAISDCFGGNSGDFCQICFNFDQNPANPQAAMWTQVFCHEPLSVSTCPRLPGMMWVDVVSYDSKGAEVDRARAVRLLRVEGDDCDPAQMVFHNDLGKPIVFIDTPLADPAAYTGVIPLFTVDDGFVGVTRSGEQP
jgi:hypothetical protein